MDRDVKKGMKVKGGRPMRSVLAVLNTMIGIGDTLLMDHPVLFSAFFCTGYMDSCLILICLCSYLDSKVKAIFECKLSTRRHQSRDILLEYKTKLREQDSKEFRILAMPCQDFRLALIPSTFHSLTMRPLHHISPSIISLFLFLLYSMVVGVAEAIIRNSTFFTAYAAVIDYCCGIGSKTLHGSTWDYLFVILGATGSILFYFAVWKISLSIVDGLGWTVGITDETTPILIP